jgi:nucleotide-binding universal stress UspA family protein
MLGRHGIEAVVETMDPGDVSGRARGRALLDYTREKGAGLLVMGAYGHRGLSNFLGLGGATSKVIASCPVPLLLAH